MVEIIDLGSGHTGHYVGWAPDRELNTQYDGIPDVERYGMHIFHTNPAGQDCVGFVTFAGDVQRRIHPDSVTWGVVSWDPLTIEPSVLCGCGDHGWIREGRWVSA